MASILYSSINQLIETPDDDSTILDTSIANKIPHLHECGGNGRCTTCRVRVLEGHQNITSRNMLEKQAAQLRKWDPSIRLACQCTVRGDVQIQRLVWSSAEVNRLQLETVPEGEAEERRIAILVCDLRNFTQITSQHMAFDMAHMLNRFYTVLGDPILINNGIIYQYVGDEIIGIFGTAGGTREQNCRDAIRAGLGMLYAVERLNRFELKDFDTAFEVGIGINFGKAFIGHLGHPKHRQFTIVGDPINVASRIQGCNKEFKTNILIPENVLRSLPENTLKTGRQFIKQLRGKEDEIRLFELEDFQEPDMNLELQSSLDFILKNEEAFAHRFYQRIFEKAPWVRSLFGRDMTAQGRLLTHMLGGIVYSLSRPDLLKMGLKSLGRSHERYGVKPEYYPLVKECLLATIKEEMADLYTDRLEQAWSTALDFITTEMTNWKTAPGTKKSAVPQ